MPILQIRNLPQKLYDELKASADKSRRSLTQEAIVLLEKGLQLSSINTTSDKNQLLKRLLEDVNKPSFCSEDATEWIRNDRDSR
ncbi:MAG: hypothetical protein LC107_08175 [Chitinophagales bacterium]|nr:hypothetical protein [Chitinophagales bacterium]